MRRHRAALVTQCLASQYTRQNHARTSTDQARTAPLGDSVEEGTSSFTGIGSWREFPAKSSLQRIDVLTFRLGHYPREIETSSPHQAEGGETATATSSVSSAGGANAAVRRHRASAPRRGGQSKKQSLDALSARAGTAQTMPSHGAPRVSKQPSPHRMTPTRAKTSPSIHPLTPRREVQRLAADWYASQSQHVQETREADDAEDAAHAAVLSHPPDLFDDEEAVLHRFGMGGRTSPAGVPGFSALFRQHWSDFWVTEMVPDDAATCGGRLLSRNFNYSVPPLPAELLAAASDEPVASPESTHTEAAVGSPDELFFQVDVAQRMSELQKEAASLLEAGRSADHTNMHGEQSIEDNATTARPSNEGDSITASLQPDRIPAPSTIAAATPHITESTEEMFAALAKEDIRLAAREMATQLKSDDQHRHTHRRHSHKAAGHRMEGGSDLLAGASHAGSYYLECALHKQHISHSVALANISQTLRIHPHAISVSGIKDFIGDTVQRVRLERVSPTAALLANRAFKKRGWRMHLSDFSYETTPLAPGDLYGNHFKIVLRDVVAARRGDVEDAMEAFRQYGFPNYYGAQRFSWFAGREDAGFALLRHNWLAFAFRFLNYTARDRSLRELLQRPHKYPHAVQDEYRRNVVRRLRQIAVEPEDLDEAPFLSLPSLNEPLTGADGGPLNQRQELIVWQLEQAFFDLQPQSRRLTAQRLSSYLWNQALTLRLHHFPSTEVLVGDHVLPASVRRQMHTLFDRQALTHRYSDVVTEANKATFTIADVVHPGFSFDGIRLPDNPVGAYYEQLCDKYSLDWRARHSMSGMRDFREPARPIVRYPIDLSYTFNPDKATLTVEFALERGCYANVAVSELMKRARCAGSESIVLLPAPEATWSGLGERDPGYVTSMQDIYEGYEDGFGFTRDEVDVELSTESERKVWDLDGPLFLPAEEDPFRKAYAWGQRHLLSNMERRRVDAERLKHQLFEKPLADKMTEEELAQYAGHNIPLSPNMRGKKVFFKVLRRNRRYAGAPKVEMRLRRGATVKNRSHKLPKFRSLNKNTWNVSW